MDQKPLKIDYTTGELAQFQIGDTLPVETDVAILKDLFNRLLVNYQLAGLPITDPILLNQLPLALNTVGGGG